MESACTFQMATHLQCSIHPLCFMLSSLNSFSHSVTDFPQKSAIPVACNDRMNDSMTT